MRVLREGAFLCPKAMLTTHLNCPSSSAVMGISPQQQPFFIVGKVNGEVVFFTTDHSEVSKCGGRFNSPITAIAVGNLRHSEKDEVVAISADGLLQSMSFPRRDGNTLYQPVILFEQFLNANICAAQIADIDGDDRNEMIVVMTDRVVRTYRFIDGRLRTLNKWEVPSQICGLSIGSTRAGRIYALLAQLHEKYIVKIEFAQKNCTILPQSTTGDGGTYELDVPMNPVQVSLIGTLTSRLFIVNPDCNTENELKNVAGDIVCVATTTLPNGLRLIVTVDTHGVLLLFGWRDNLVPQALPLVRCHVLADAEYVSAVADKMHENTLFVALSTLYFKVAIYRVDLSSIVQIKKH
ncbi:Integrin-alpha FG-GAP repeat-containing protein 2 [Toxocara canis]|nr:Integrin-alpha FG-GAP repeat-containing protein 2 [Toxocara canis]